MWFGEPDCTSLRLTVTNNKITHWQGNYSPVWLTFVLADWLAQGPDTFHNWHAHRRRTPTRFCLYTRALAWIHGRLEIFVCTYGSCASSLKSTTRVCADRDVTIYVQKTVFFKSHNRPDDKSTLKVTWAWPSSRPLNHMARLFSDSHRLAVQQPLVQPTDQSEVYNRGEASLIAAVISIFI